MIDPHTHSTASDGRSTPTQLMWEAREARLAMIGLTDHDTVAGWQEAAAQVAPTGVSLLRGMEISAKLEGVSVHLLGYLFNPGHEKIVAHMERMLDARRGRARKMVARIAADWVISWEQVEHIAGEGTPIGRPHIADALIANGVVASRDEAFERFLRPGSQYYVPHYAPDAHDVVEWVNDAGGKVIFAHPHGATRGKVPRDQAIMELAEAGLFGLEIDHRDNCEVEALESIARAAGLVRTGASDYHGSGKPNRLGENTTDEKTIELIARDAFLEVLVP